MATSTRILQGGSNPFGGGNVVFDSTPFTQFAIAQKQREQAKDEALDKYFMDYDKNINPAGMRNAEIPDLLRLTNENRDFYFKNKEAIKDPSVDNGKAYSEWSNRNKSALGLISQSKQDAETEKFYNNQILKAREKGLPITDATLQNLDKFRLPRSHKNFRELDANDIDFQPKQFDPLKFSKDIYNGIKQSDLPPVFTKDPQTGQIIQTTESRFDPQNLGAVESRASSAYRTSPSVKFYIDQLSSNPNEVLRLNQVYKKHFGNDLDIQHPEQLTTALALSMGDTRHEKVTAKIDPLSEARKAEWDRRNAITFAQSLKRLAISNANIQERQNIGIDAPEQFIQGSRTGIPFGGEEGKGVEKLNFSPIIANDYKKVIDVPATPMDQQMKDAGAPNYKTKKHTIIPQFGLGLNDGKIYSVIPQQEPVLDPKTGKPTGEYKDTDKIDWTKSEAIPDVSIRSTISNKALPSKYKSGQVISQQKQVQQPKQKTLAELMMEAKNKK